MTNIVKKAKGKRKKKKGKRNPNPLTAKVAKLKKKITKS